jgi:hypothetical protein
MQIELEAISLADATRQDALDGTALKPLWI